MQNIFFFIRENLMLSMIWFILLLLITSLTIQNILSKFTLINYHKAKNLIDNENAIIIDTRLVEFFDKSHIINAMNISLKDILSGNIDKLKVFKIYPIILIFSDLHQCYDCTYALYKYGFHRIYVLEQGIESCNVHDLISSDNKKRLSLQR